MFHACAGQNGGAPTTWISQYFYFDSWLLAASDVYECIPAVKPSICSHIPLECAGGGHIKLNAIMSIIRIISIIFTAIIVIMEIICRETDNAYNIKEKISLL